MSAFLIRDGYMPAKGRGHFWYKVHMRLVVLKRNGCHFVLKKSILGKDCICLVKPQIVVLKAPLILMKTTTTGRASLMAGSPQY